MPAYFDSGFLVGKPAWHGLGTVLNAPPTIEDGIKLAGLDWECELQESATVAGLKMQTRAVVRKTDSKILGEVGSDYAILQNIKAFEFFQPFIDAKTAELHTAGSLHGGEVVWVLAKLTAKNSVIRPDDEIGKFAMLSNGHNGKLSVRVGFTPIRIVCANTLAMAHADAASKLIRIRHRGNVEKNVADVREIMDLANEQFETTAEIYAGLAKRKNINSADLKKYVRVVLGQDETPDEDLSTRMKNIIENIIRRFEVGMGNKGESWWDAYNAVTEYLNYEQGNNADNRLKSLWFGGGPNSGWNLNKFALEQAMEFAQIKG